MTRQAAVYPMFRLAALLPGTPALAPSKALQQAPVQVQTSRPLAYDASFHGPASADRQSVLTLLLDLICRKTTIHVVLMGAGTMTRLDAYFSQHIGFFC